MSLESMRDEPKIKYVRRWQYVYDLLWQHRVGVRSFAVRMGFDISGVYRWFREATLPLMDNIIILCQTLELIDGRSWETHLLMIVKCDYDRGLDCDYRPFVGMVA
jgi:hypothetical protein